MLLITGFLLFVVAMSTKVFSPTYVEYPSSHPIATLIALVSVLPAFAYSALLALAIGLRSIRAVSALAGLSVAHGVNAVLKKIIAEPRPVPLPGTIVPLKSYGMVCFSNRVSCMVLLSWVKACRTDACAPDPDFST